MRTFLQKIKALFTKSDVEKTSLQKTARFAIIAAAIVLVGLIVYFAIVAPLLHAEENFIPELFEGEVYNGALYMLPTYTRDQIKSIEIKNDVDHYTMVAYLTESGETQFQIEGHEDTALSVQQISYFITSARNLITNAPAGQARVNEKATAEDLKSYGLDAASDPAWFKVTLNDGSSYQVNIGNALVTTKGYYVTLEGRKNVVDGVEYDIVYALQSSLSETMLANSAALVSTELAPYDDNIYQATLFSVEKYIKEKRAPVVMVGLVSDQGISASSTVYEMLYPASYVINEDNYSNYVLTNLAYIVADSVLAYGDAVHDPAVYEKYSLDLDIERLKNGTDKNFALLSFSTEDPESEHFNDRIVTLYFSEKQTDLDGVEFYYVYSPVKSVIARISAETFEFLEWSIANYTNPYLYYEYFTSCEAFSIVCEREGLDHLFTLSGKERVRKADVTTTGGQIIYTETATGAKIPLVYQTKYEQGPAGMEYYGEFELFRDLYYVLITRSLALYAEVNENITTVAEAPMATITVKTSPKDHPLSYYDHLNGNSSTQIRDEGGNILCHEVLVPTTLSDGTVKNISYDKAFYDVEAKRFFLKVQDGKDANDKPAGYEVTDIGTVKVTTFLPNTAYGEYNETIYSYEIYDLYDEYTDYDGKEVRSMNSTYKYILPTTTTNTYRLVSGGEKELIETKTEIAEVGVYIRTATIEKLFSDTHKLMNGEPIDTMGLN